MTSTSTASRLSLTVIRASDIKWDPTNHRRLPNLYVQAEFNNVKRRTRTVKRNLSPRWDESLSFDLPPTGHVRRTKFNVQVRHDSSWKDKCVGEIEVELSDLLSNCTHGKETELRLNMARDAASIECTAVLHLRLEAVDAMTGASRNIDDVEQAIQNSDIPTSAVATDSALVTSVDAATNYFQGHADLYDSVGTLVSKLDVFVRAMDALSQVHPYVIFAWQVASALYKAVEHQFEVDKKIVELAHVMKDAFGFIDQTESLPEKTERLETTIRRLLEQTDECCLFIQEYARRKFARRMIMLDANSTIDEFLHAYRSLKDSMDSEIGVHVAFVSSRIYSKVDALTLKVDAMSSKVDVSFLENRLQPEKMRAFDRPQCLPGTRLEILERAVEWALSDSSQNIFWLYGVAGSGKSTVSTTIAEHFRGISRLGAHLFFERGKSEPSSVICTLAYKLALFDSSVARHVLEAIEQDNDIALAPGSTQFAKLINDPLVQVGKAMQGPVIIVLDALDECGTGSSRKHLLELLRERLPTLPRNFRFFITSRRELDIDRAFSSRLECICAVELVHDSTTCKDDVHRYIDYEMRKVFAKNTLQISGDWQTKMDHLGGAADGLFVWASTAVKMVDCDDPIRKLKELTSRSHNLSGLNHLYNSVLRDSGILFDDEASKTRFSRILGLIILGKYPLTDNMIDELLGYSDERPSRLTLSRLRSVLVYTPGTPIRFCHTSFRDYLLSPDCKSDPWFIDPEAQNEFITSRCFDVMRDKLQFNICDIESSYISNDRIPDLPDRIKAKIPPHLDYACLFWSQHLQDLQFTHALLGVLTEFLHERLFYWLEVMSLLRRVNSASPAFLRVINWVSSRNAEVLAFLRDARRIITRFALPISESIPQIYVSVLPFASMESKLIARYLKPDTSNIRIEQIGEKQRSPLLQVLTGHTDWVNSVAFSPDGTRVASASDDKTVLIWDAESGRVISGPFEGHERSVCSVAFSPDGARVASGSKDKTIRVWDIENGQVVSGPLEGHTDSVPSVAFSSDGMHVFSGSTDKTIMVWDIESRQAVKCLEGHVGAVNSVALSPDGKHIVSGSDDETIRIWNVEKGQTICDPRGGHVDAVWSVAFSHDGTRVASGAADNTIRIWESGQCLSVPFEGHDDEVCSVAFSPDGKRVVSGSDDRTIRIWDVVTGQVVCGPFKGHTDYVRSVAFSPDGTRVVSGSEDGTVRIWDAESVHVVSGHFEGHVDEVTSVSFSPSGRLIASGSDDTTIRIWEAESGKVVSGPFKGHSSYVLSVAFSPDGRKLASGSSDRTIRVWDTVNGDIVSGPFEGHEEQVFSVCFSSDGTRIVSGSEDQTLRIWDAHSGETISGPFRGHESWVVSVASSPDGRRVVSGSGDKTIIIWDSESGEVISGPLRGHTDWVWSVAFSSDGTRVASGSDDTTVLIWNVESGQVAAGPLKGHTSSVRSVAFSPDGAHVVSSSNDKTIRVWDTESGQAIFEPFEGHTSFVVAVAFSPNGRHIISGSRDHTIRMWNVEDPVFDWTLGEDGWIRGREDELILWVPPDIRPTLWRSQNTAVFSCPFSTRLDLSSAALGERWQECFERPQ